MDDPSLIGLGTRKAPRRGRTPDRGRLETDPSGGVDAAPFEPSRELHAAPDDSEIDEGQRTAPPQLLGGLFQLL